MMKINFKVYVNDIYTQVVPIYPNFEEKDIDKYVIKLLNYLKILYSKHTLSFFKDSDSFTNKENVISINKLKENWDNIIDGYMFIESITETNNLIAPSTQCIKVGSLRKETGDENINLKIWMEDPKNLYVGRRGRIFISYPDKEKKIFHYSASKWENPYKVGKDEYSLEESLRLYKQHIINSGLINDINELSDKTLGCFCNQSGNCHAKVLVELFNEYSN